MLKLFLFVCLKLLKKLISLHHLTMLLLLSFVDKNTKIIIIADSDIDYINQTYTHTETNKHTRTSHTQNFFCFHEFINIPLSIPAKKTNFDRWKLFEQNKRKNVLKQFLLFHFIGKFWNNILNIKKHWSNHQESMNEWMKYGIFVKNNKWKTMKTESTKTEKKQRNMINTKRN